MTAQEAQKAFQEELVAWQKETKFSPSAGLPDFFNSWVRLAFSAHSPAGLKVSLQDYMDIINANHIGYSLLSMASTIYILQQKSPDQMKMEYEDYFAYQNDLDIIMKEVSAINKPKAEELQAKYNAMITVNVAPANSKQYPRSMQSKLNGKQGKKIPLPQNAEA